MVLPLQSLRNNSGTINNSNGNTTEPHGYYRWYDYKTDKNSSLLKIHNGNVLGNASWGYYCVDYPSGIVKSDAGVMRITLPKNSEGEIIACDVSDYLDYSFANGIFIEPTINIRYLFNVRPAKEQADIIKNTTKPSQKLFYERNGDVTLNCRNDATTFTLRVNNRLPANDFFSPLTQKSITEEGTWGTTYVQGGNIRWFVVQNGNIIYAYTAGTNNAINARFFTFSKSQLTGVNYNEPFEIFAYVTSTTTTTGSSTWTTSAAATTQWKNLANKVPIVYNRCFFTPVTETVTMDGLPREHNRKRTYEHLFTR